MEYERVLIFCNRKSASYWFDKMIKFFKERNFFVRAYRGTNMIIVNNRITYFKANKEINEAFTRGRHKAMYYYCAEKQLEEKFLGTIEELING